MTVWKWSGESRYPRAFPPVLENFCRVFSPGPLIAPGSPRMILLRPWDEELVSMIGEANARQNTNNHKKIAAQSLENDGNHENSRISKLKRYQ